MRVVVSAVGVVFIVTKAEDSEFVSLALVGDTSLPMLPQTQYAIPVRML